MNSKQIWYILLPQNKKYAGPFDTNGVLSLLNLGRVRVDSYIWSPQNPNESWKMLIEYPIFKNILTTPKFLFSLEEEDYLKIYRALNNTSGKIETRPTWFETYIQKEVQTPVVTETNPEIVTTAPIPKRSKRVPMTQTIYAKVDGKVRTAKEFILSKNGVYFNVVNPYEFPIGTKLGLATIYLDTKKTINMNGVVTCEDECEAGKNIGIRFTNLDPKKQTIIDNWVEAIAAS